MRLKNRCIDISGVLSKAFRPSAKKPIMLVAAATLLSSYWLSDSIRLDRTIEQGGLNRSLPVFSGKKAIQHLKETGQYESVSAAMTAVRYEVEQSNEIATAANYANQMRGTFTPTGLQLQSSAKGTRWQSRWRLQSLGHGDHQMKVGDGEVRTSGNRVTIAHQIKIAHSAFDDSLPVIEEWFHNTPAGLEHGFTLPERLGKTAEKLLITIAVDGDLTPRSDANGQTLTLVDRNGAAVLNYEKLKVWDANGLEVFAQMTAENGAVVLEVEDAAAKYPLTIDPIFSTAAKVVANDSEDFDGLGQSVAISGDTIVVGAPEDDIGSNLDEGSAYVFVRGANGIWSQQIKLIAAGGGLSDRFGTSVAISGETVVVGAPLDDIGSNESQGSVYIFVRNGVSWSQQQKLFASDGGSGDVFGDDNGVSISGNTVIVGSPGSEVGDNVNEGAAYVYLRSGTTWSLQQKLTAIGGAEHDGFGFSVAISGSSAIVGARRDDISGNEDQGSACVFTRTGTTWTQQQELVASDGAADDRFGTSVDIETGILGSADAVVGTFSDDVNGNSGAGSAYVFVRSGSTWTQQQKLTASDGDGGDRFGVSVAISGGTVVVGAYNHDVGANPVQGAAYVFRRSGGTTWNQRQKLIAYDGVASDQFGVNVALSTNTVVVGAYKDDLGPSPDRGSAHIFHLGSKPFDFDDDGRADISVFRPSNGSWYLQLSTAGFTGVQFGVGTDLAAAGDYDGDGESDVAVFRGSVGTWYLLQSSAGFASIQFGQPGDLPVPADADGDGETDVRVFRPSNGTWYWLNSSNGQFNAVQFGASGDRPMVGNFDGDSYADLAVFRASAASWYLLRTTGGFAGIQFGASGDVPVSGDFDGDGRTDLAVFRPSNGAWYRLDSSTGQFVGIGFGQNGDIPAPADFEGDGKTDLAVFRPSNGTWYLLQSTGFAAVQFGANGDTPVPAQP